MKARATDSCLEGSTQERKEIGYGLSESFSHGWQQPMNCNVFLSFSSCQNTCSNLIRAMRAWSLEAHARVFNQSSFKSLQETKTGSLVLWLQRRNFVWDPGGHSSETSSSLSVSLFGERVRTLLSTAKEGCIFTHSAGGFCRKPGILSGFQGYRGPLARDFEFENWKMVATLSHSKTIGSDRALTFRPVVDDAESHVQERNWLRVGRQLLGSCAPREMNNLLPTPSNDFKRCRNSELRDDTAFAARTRLIPSRTFRCQRLFSSKVVDCPTPHSGRN